MRIVLWRQIRCRRLDCSNASYSLQQFSHGWRLATRTTGLLHPSKPRTFQSSTVKPESDPSFLSLEVDRGFSLLEQNEEAILDRAKVHGIDTLQRLAYEADLGPVRGLGERLLHDKAIRQDLDLWAIVLDYRRLRDGPNGVQAVLAAMLYGGEPISLHTDAVSEHIWRTILPVALAEESLLYQLCQVGSSFMRDRPFVFADIVGHLLASGDLRLAITFGTQYLISYFQGHSDLMNLFNVTFQLGSGDGIEHFCQLLSRLPRHRVYNDTVSKLWAAGRTQHAFKLHRHLLLLGDYPHDFGQIQPFIQELASQDIKLEPFLYELELHGISYSHQARRVYKLERLRLVQKSGKSANLTFGSGPGARPVKLRDAFVARTFATRSVSFDFVLSGLRFIGLFEIGPLAVRELALAVENTTELRKRFEQIDSMGVDIGASNFVHVVKNLCMSKRDDLLQAVLDSDMHQDEFEDVQKQKRLLTEYCHANRWLESDRTLAILNSGETSDETNLRSAQLMLQTTLIEGDWRGTLVGLDNLRNSYQSTTRLSSLAPLRLALTRIWASVGFQAKTNLDYLDRYTYLVGLMQLSQVAGLRAYAWQWRSVLHAVGRSGDWVLFHRLVLSVARMFHYIPIRSSSDACNQPFNRPAHLDEVFDSKMQSFVIEISLVAGVEDQGPEMVWLRGVKLLLKLRNLFQLNIDYDILSLAFKIRLQELFSGVEVGMQRRFVSHYLSCFNWAWSEAVLPHEGNISHTLYQRGLSIPDTTALRLFQVRTRLVRQRRYPVDPQPFTGIGGADEDSDGTSLVEVEGIVSEGQQENTKSTTGLWANTSEGQNDSTVFYEDLLHPSYKKAEGVHPL